MTENKVVSLDQFRAKKKSQEEDAPVNGVMVWLHCPSCHTYEYTEIASPYGRQHKCGMMVTEIEVNLDLRAEYTISSLNIEIVSTIKKDKNIKELKAKKKKEFLAVLDLFEKNERIYLERLGLAAGKPLTPYSVDPNKILDELPIKQKNEIGLFISHFRFEPEKRFSDNQE